MIQRIAPRHPSLPDDEQRNHVFVTLARARSAGSPPPSVINLPAHRVTFRTTPRYTYVTYTPSSTNLQACDRVTNPSCLVRSL